MLSRVEAHGIAVAWQLESAGHVPHLDARDDHVLAVVDVDCLVAAYATSVRGPPPWDNPTRALYAQLGSSIAQVGTGPRVGPCTLCQYRTPRRACEGPYWTILCVSTGHARRTLVPFWPSP
eukprot:2497173-Rhodomonas_salina.2